MKCSWSWWRWCHCCHLNRTQTHFPDPSSFSSSSSPPPRVPHWTTRTAVCIFSAEGPFVRQQTELIWAHFSMTNRTVEFREATNRRWVEVIPYLGNNVNEVSGLGGRFDRIKRDRLGNICNDYRSFLLLWPHSFSDLCCIAVFTRKNSRLMTMWMTVASLNCCASSVVVANANQK